MSTQLLAVPNVSEGRDEEAIAAIAAAFTSGPSTSRLLDVHSDPDHHRTVYTLAGEPGSLAGAVRDGAREAITRIDLSRHAGAHPRVGAIDVAPIVHLSETDRGAAIAEALVLADMLGDELGLAVFLYGELAGGRTRAMLRRGGPEELARRVSAGELSPDFGPPQLHDSAGAVLVAARPSLVAFNLELSPPARAEEARRIAAEIRDGAPDGLPGVRAIGVWLERRGRAQVSTNVEDHTRVSLAQLLDAVRSRSEVAETELVGLAPASAFTGFPDDVIVRNRALIEDKL